MPLLGGCHLVNHTGHAPGGAGVILVVCMDADIVSCHIHSCDVINDLLVVSGVGILDGLLDTGGDLGIGAGEHGVVGVGGLGFFGLSLRGFRGLVGNGFLCGRSGFLHLTGQSIAGQVIQVIRKSIAGSVPQVSFALQIPVALQHGDGLVIGISLINGIAHIFIGQQAGEALVQEEFRTGLVRQIFGKIALEQIAQLVCLGQHLVQIEGIQVAVNVFPAEGTVAFHAQIVLPDVLGQLLDGCAGCLALGKLHQVTQVAAPACQVIGAHIVGYIADVQGAEHVLKLQELAVGHFHQVDIPKTAHLGAALFIHGSHISRELGFFILSQRVPQALGISLNTAADIVDHQQLRIFLGIQGRKFRGIVFQNHQVFQEYIIVIYIQLFPGLLGCFLRGIRVFKVHGHFHDGLLGNRFRGRLGLSFGGFFCSGFRRFFCCSLGFGLGGSVCHSRLHSGLHCRLRILFRSFGGLLLCGLRDGLHSGDGAVSGLRFRSKCKGGSHIAQKQAGCQQNRQVSGKNTVLHFPCPTFTSNSR